MNHISGLIAGKQYTYHPVLCRPSREAISYIPYSSITFTNAFRDFNTLNIDIPRQITDDLTKEYIDNPIWDVIKTDYLIELTVFDGDVRVHHEYFVIESPSYSGGEQDLKSYQCGAFERKYFNFKILEGFRDRQKVLFDPTNTIDSDGLPLGILNYIIDYKCFGAWTVTYIDPRLVGIERVFTFSDSTLTNVINLLEDLYGCIFVFDNVNMTIALHVAEIGALGVNNGLVISDTNYISSINYNENTEGIATRLFVKGKGEANIAKYNPTGQRYIDDFTWFLPFMSEGLRNAVIAYQALIESVRGLFESYVIALDMGDESVIPLIEALRLQLAFSNNFTPAQLVELSFFVRETQETVNQISDERQLYEFGKRKLRTLAYPPITITVDSIDIFSIPDYQLDWAKITKIGDYANIVYEPLGLNYLEMRLVSYTHNPIDNSFSMEFSNQDEIATMHLLDFSFYNTFNYIAGIFNAEVDSYRAFGSERDSLLLAGQTINAGTTNVAISNMQWNNSGIVVNAHSGGNLRNRIFINPTDGIRVTLFEGAVEVNLMSLNPANGRLQLSSAHTDWV